MTCQECNGTGLVNIFDYSEEGPASNTQRYRDGERNCPECDGRGEIPDESVLDQVWTLAE